MTHTPSIQHLFKLREIDIFLPSRPWQSRPSRSRQQRASWSSHCGCPCSRWWCMLCGNKHRHCPVRERSSQRLPLQPHTLFPLSTSSLTITSPHPHVFIHLQSRKSLNSVWGWFWLALSTDWELHHRHVVFIFQLQDSHQLWNIWTEMLSENLISHSLKCEQTWDNSWQRAWEERGVLPSRPHWKGVGQGLSGIMFRMLSGFKKDIWTHVKSDSNMYDFNYYWNNKSQTV